MKKIYIVIFIFLLLLVNFSNTQSKILSHSNKKVFLRDIKVEYKNIGSNYKIIEKSLLLSDKEIREFKEKLLLVTNKYNGSKCIENQITLFEQYKILPSNLTIDLKNFYNKKSTLYNKFSISLHKLTVISHLTFGGRIKGLYVNDICNKSFKINFTELLNGTYIDGLYGILPYYIGYSFLPVYISSFSLNKDFETKKYRTFFEALFPCIGTTIALKNQNDDVILELNLDFCIIGFTGGIEF